MERIQQQVQEFQTTLDGKGYGHLGLGVAGALMLFVFCPMSIVAVAASYWTQSQEMHGYEMSIKVSLWKVSTSVNGASQSQDVCGDDMSGFDDCGKIYALRCFTVTALLLSLASGVILTWGFTRFSKLDASMSRKMQMIGVSLSAVVLLWDFLCICIAASVDASESSLNGAGFIFLILELLFVSVATALVACVLTRWSTQNKDAGETRVVQVGARSHSDASSGSHPNLLTVVCTAPQDKGPSPKDARRQGRVDSPAPQWAALSPKMQTLNLPVKERSVEEESLPNANTETPSTNMPQQANEAPLRLSEVEEVEEKDLEAPLSAGVAKDGEGVTEAETSIGRNVATAEGQAQDIDRLLAQAATLEAAS